MLRIRFAQVPPAAPFVICTALRHKERTESRPGDSSRSVRHLYRSATQRANGARVRLDPAFFGCASRDNASPEAPHPLGPRETTPVAPDRLGPAAPPCLPSIPASRRANREGLSLSSSIGEVFVSGPGISIGQRGVLLGPVAISALLVREPEGLGFQAQRRKRRGRSGTDGPLGLERCGLSGALGAGSPEPTGYTPAAISRPASKDFRGTPSGGRLMGHIRPFIAPRGEVRGNSQRRATFGPQAAISRPA